MNRTKHTPECLSVGGGPQDDDCICGATNADQTTMKDLVAQAHRKIQNELPEDEPDCVPDWVCELLIKFGMEIANKEPS